MHTHVHTTPISLHITARSTVSLAVCASPSSSSSFADCRVFLSIQRRRPAPHFPSSIQIIASVESRLNELAGERDELAAYQKLDRTRRALEYCLYSSELKKVRAVGFIHLSLFGQASVISKLPLGFTTNSRFHMSSPFYSNIYLLSVPQASEELDALSKSRENEGGRLGELRAAAEAQQAQIATLEAEVKALSAKVRGVPISSTRER